MFNIVVGIISTFATLLFIYDRIIKPKHIKTKLRKLNILITEWYDYIDINLDKKIEYNYLNNLESKIYSFISINNLKNYKFKITKKLIKKWNKEMGLKKELWNDKEQFEKFSRLDIKNSYLQVYINILFGCFLSFHNEYKNKNGKPNFAEIKMRVKFIQFYVNNL